MRLDQTSIARNAILLLWRRGHRNRSQAFPSTDLSSGMDVVELLNGLHNIY